MKMASAGAGPGTSVKDYRLIFVFENEKALSQFLDSAFVSGASVKFPFSPRSKASPRSIEAPREHLAQKGELAIPQIDAGVAGGRDFSPKEAHDEIRLSLTHNRSDDVGGGESGNRSGATK